VATGRVERRSWSQVVPSERIGSSSRRWNTGQPIVMDSAVTLQVSEGAVSPCEEPPVT
jgi:hypothetical protein